MTTLEIQRRLFALGFDPGPLDGVRGRLTVRAIKAFQAKCGLAADGIVGRKTEAALQEGGAGQPRPQTPSPHAKAGVPAFDAKDTSNPGTPGLRGGGVPPVSRQALPWYEEALRLKGMKEAAGGADNPTILKWAKRLGLAYAHDSIAWCGLFVGHCIGAALPEEPLPTNPLGARNWQRFGVESKPTLGAILVFWRGSRAGALGHVGFYAGEDASAFHVLGGNQSDSVSIARVARTRLLGARWPVTAPKPEGGAIRRAETGALSTNEA